MDTITKFGNFNLEARFRIRCYSGQLKKKKSLSLPPLERVWMVHLVDLVSSPFRFALNVDRITTLSHQQNICTIVLMAEAYLRVFGILSDCYHASYKR